MNYPPPIYYLIIPALLWSNSGCSLITDFDGANSTEPAVTDAQVGPGLLDMDLGIADIGTPNLDARRIDLSAPDLGPDDQETEPDMLGADAGPRDIDAQCSDAARLVDEAWCQAVAADGAEPNCRTACERVFFCVDADSVSTMVFPLTATRNPVKAVESGKLLSPPNLNFVFYVFK